MFDPVKLLRPHLQSLVPYSSARDDYQGNEGIFLDANENPIGSITDRKWNRYPDPYQAELKAKIAEVKGVSATNIFLEMVAMNLSICFLGLFVSRELTM